MKLQGMLILVVLLLVAAPAAAQKAYIDFDEEYDASHVKTYAWAKTDSTSLAESDPLTHSRVVSGIEHRLAQSGLIEVESDPDVFVTYHASSEKELRLNTTDWGYGYPSSWYYHPYHTGYYAGAGFGSSTTTVTEYTTGTLIIDVWDAETNQLVWRGTAAGIYVPDSPQKLAKNIDKALAKIVKKWEDIKAKRAKAEAKAAKQAAKGK